MLLLKLPFSAFVQLTKNWITSPNIRLYQLQWDNYHHGIHKTLYFQNEIINQSCLWDWSKGKYLQDDSQSCLFSRGVGVFDLIFLRHFLTKMRSFCAHQKGNFLNFSKLTLLLSLDHSWCPQWPIKRYRAFFLGHPVLFQYLGKYLDKVDRVMTQVDRITEDIDHMPVAAFIFRDQESDEVHFSADIRWTF